MDAARPATAPHDDPAEVLDLLIVGSGFSGLCLALLAQRAGHRWRLFEQADSLGGTWRDNHYPGAACDIPSNLYSLSFMPNPAWSRLFPSQAEIRAYMERCADDGGIRAGLRFGAEVTRAAWDETAMLWRITLADGRQACGRTLALGTGGLSRPQLPQVPGLDSFQGALFHSARWRDDVALQGRRVGVIGTGASAIQIVPAIAPQCGQLTLFQRTPAWILPRGDRAVPEATRAAYRRAPWRQRLARAWTYVSLEWRAWPFTRAPGLLKAAQRHGLHLMARQVRDPALRRRLTPAYTLGCKRVLLSDNFYPALNQPQVRLVDQAVVRVTPTGVVCADGSEHALDVLIAATGFQVAEAGAPFPVLGRAGRDLNAVWAGGAQAHRGTLVAGFPNLFLMTGPNTGLGHNSMVYMIESQARFVMQALQGLKQRGAGGFQVIAEAQQRYNEDLQRRLARTVWNTGGCRSWYLGPDGSNRTLWPDHTFRFRRQLARFDWSELEWLNPGVTPR